MRHALAALLLLAGCSGGEEIPDANLVNEIESLRSELMDRDAEISNLKVALNEEIARRRGSAPEAISAGKLGSGSRDQPTRERPAMCYKDYCPCDPPQGGPDQIICDQLEEGIDVPVEMLISGRGMREARRQMAEGDY
ncbi:hypothetical protein [Sphingomonas sp.]|uniref:hypothetical protein n=1 Tax=Sphingomonas sp. TaxID=28214 RepID=UPI003BAC3D62